MLRNTNTTCESIKAQMRSEYIIIDIAHGHADSAQYSMIQHIKKESDTFGHCWKWTPEAVRELKMRELMRLRSESALVRFVSMSRLTVQVVGTGRSSLVLKSSARTNYCDGGIRTMVTLPNRFVSGRLWSCDWFLSLQVISKVLERR